MANTFWADLGRKLVYIRSSDAFDVEATANRAATEYQRQLLNCPDDGRSIGKVLNQLEAVGLLKHGTAFSAEQRRQGYSGLWDASLPTLEGVQAIQAQSLNDLSTVRIFQAEVQVLSQELPSHQFWPPALRRLPRNLADLKRCQTVIKEEIRTAWNLLSEAEQRLLAMPPPPATPPSNHAPCARPGCACAGPGGSSYDGTPGKFCCRACRRGDPCRKLWHKEPLKVRKQTAYVRYGYSADPLYQHFSQIQYEEAVRASRPLDNGQGTPLNWLKHGIVSASDERMAH